MSVTSIDTNPVHRRTGAMGKLSGLLFVALLLPTVPASAASFVTRERVPVSRLADAGGKGENGCALPRLSLHIGAPLVLRPSAGHYSAGNSPIVENRWASGATSDWNAGMNRAVDQLVGPPEHVSVYATQTGAHLYGHLEGTRSPNETLAGFAVVIH